MEKGRTETARKVKDVPLIEINTAPRILLIVTDKDSLDTDKEVNLKNDLEATFDAVVEVAQSDTDIDSGNWDPKRYRLIICCNGITPTDVNDLKSTKVPVISLDEDVSITALNMASTGGNSASETQTKVTDITHQIISEALRQINPESIAIGNKNVYSAAGGIDYITTLGSGGKSLSEDTTTAAEEHIVVYDEDAVLQDSSLAAEIRIHFGLYQINLLTATGRELFRHAVEYALYTGGESAWADIKALIEGLGSRKVVIELDYREVDLTATAGTKTYASRTIAATELYDSKDGSNGEVDKIEIIVDIDYVEDSASANGLDLTTAAHNQWQINVAAAGADDLPLAIAGSLSGQHVSGDFEVPANGGGHTTLKADISDLTNSTLKENVDQAIVVTLLNGRALGNNLRLKVATYIVVSYNGKA